MNRSSDEEETLHRWKAKAYGTTYGSVSTTAYFPQLHLHSAPSRLHSTMITNANTTQAPPP